MSSCTTLPQILEKNWKTIREEGLAQFNSETGSFVPEEENLRDTGEWKQLTLYQQGRRNDRSCERTPRTCRLIDAMPEARGCKRGQVGGVELISGRMRQINFITTAPDFILCFLFFCG